MYRFRRINFVSNSSIPYRILSLLSEELYILVANIHKFLFISIIFQVVGLALNIGG